MRKEKDRKRRRGETEKEKTVTVGKPTAQKRRKRTGDEKRWSQWVQSALQRGGESRYRVRRKSDASRGAAGPQRAVPRRRRKTTADRRRRKGALASVAPERKEGRDGKGRTWRGLLSWDQRRRREPLQKERGARMEVKRWAEVSSETTVVKWRSGDLLGRALASLKDGERVARWGLVEARRRQQVSKRVRGTKRAWCRLARRLQRKARGE